MAKRPRQQRISGTYDQPVKAVQTKAEKYVELLYDRMETQEAENVARNDLIEVMTKNEVKACEVGGCTVTLVHTEGDKINVKKNKEQEE